MPLIEDAEYERLTRRLQEGESAIPSKRLLDMLGKNPKHRAALLQMMKDANPEMAIPEIDAAKPVLDKVDALAKDFADYRKANEDEKTERDKKARESRAGSEVEQGRIKLRKAGYTPEGVEKIEKLMGERGLIDYEAAAALFDRQTPPDMPVLPTNFGRAMPMIDDTAPDDLKKAVSFPKGRAQDQALKRWTNSQLQAGMADIIKERRGGF